MSEINILTSTSTTAKNERLTLAREIKKYDTCALVNFLKEVDLPLMMEDFEIITNKEITGQEFLKLNEQTLREYDMEDDTATKLAAFIDFINEEKIIFSHKILKFVRNELNLNEEQMSKFKEKVQELEKDYETGMSIKIRNSRLEKSTLHPLDIESESETISPLDRSIEMVLEAKRLAENIDFTKTKNNDEVDDEEDDNPIEAITTRVQVNRIGEIISDINNIVPVKKYWCRECENGYVQESGLNRHIRNKH